MRWAGVVSGCTFLNKEQDKGTLIFPVTVGQDSAVDFYHTEV